MTDFVRIGLLLDYYGELITKRQRALLKAFIDDDLSLSEIAEQEGVSRQGVHDAIKRGQKKLEAFEQKLGLIKLNQKLEGVDKIIDTAKSLDVLETSKQNKQRLIEYLVSLKG